MNTKMMLVVAAALAGCATTPVPADKLARSQAAIASAETMNAAADPKATLHLKLAKEQLENAKALMKDGDNEAAGMVLLRAEADGEAAANLARARAAQIEAQKTIEMVRQTMAQMQEGSGS
jgi:hypothetical protein